MPWSSMPARRGGNSAAMLRSFGQRHQGVLCWHQPALAGYLAEGFVAGASGIATFNPAPTMCAR